MFKFISGNIGYFIVMGILLLCFVLVEGPLAGKIGCLGIMSLAMGTPVAKQTRFGLIDTLQVEVFHLVASNCRNSSFSNSNDTFHLIYISL